MSDPVPMVGSILRTVGVQQGSLTVQRCTRPYLIAIVSAAWLAAIALAVVASPETGGWERLTLTIAGAGTVSLVFWPRTTHPDLAWEGGIAEGRRLERAAMESQPRTGELRIVR